MLTYQFCQNWFVSLTSGIKHTEVLADVKVYTIKFKQLTKVGWSLHFYY